MSKKVVIEIEKNKIISDGISAVQIQGVSLALCKLGDRYYAFHDSCTHEEWPLSESYLVDGELVCSLHGAAYNPQTGACLRGPACDDLKTYPVYEQGEILMVEMETQE